jgi:hypothetical protein
MKQYKFSAELKFSFEIRFLTKYTDHVTIL